MLLHPEVQQKAQEHIDAVVGSGRLPNFSDRPFLPYIDAIVNECLRWQPVLNLGKWKTVREYVIRTDSASGSNSQIYLTNSLKTMCTKATLFQKDL